MIGAKLLHRKSDYIRNYGDNKVFTVNLLEDQCIDKVNAMLVKFHPLMTSHNSKPSWTSQNHSCLNKQNLPSYMNIQLHGIVMYQMYI